MSIFSSNKDSKTESSASTSPAPRSTSPTSKTTSGSGMSRPAGATVIAQGTQVDGNLKIESNIQIEGVVKGTLTSKGKVIVGATGVVEGDILCQHSEISGKVNGKLKVADILFLKSSAKVDGDIQTGKLVMESGVEFNGNCTMGTVSTVPAGSKAPAASATNAK